MDHGGGARRHLQQYVALQRRANLEICPRHLHPTMRAAARQICRQHRAYQPLACAVTLVVFTQSTSIALAEYRVNAEPAARVISALSARADAKAVPVQDLVLWLPKYLIDACQRFVRHVWEMLCDCFRVGQLAVIFSPFLFSTLWCYADAVTAAAAPANMDEIEQTKNQSYFETTWGPMLVRTLESAGPTFIKLGQWVRAFKCKRLYLCYVAKPVILNLHLHMYCTGKQSSGHVFMGSVRAPERAPR